MRSRAVRRDLACWASMAFGASAFADFFLFVANLGDEFGDRAHVGLEAKRAGVNFGGEDVVDGESGGLDTFAHEGSSSNYLQLYYTSGARGGVEGFR